MRLLLIPHTLSEIHLPVGLFRPIFGSGAISCWPMPYALHQSMDILSEETIELVHLSILLNIVSYLKIYQLYYSFSDNIIIIISGSHCFRYVNLYLFWHLPVTASSFLCVIILMFIVRWFVHNKYNTIHCNSIYVKLRVCV